MPAPTYPVPQSPSPIQLYRHLLRECSYLPPAFRATIGAIIQDRFHRHRKNDPRPKLHISRAISGLRTLRAANGGDKKAMSELIWAGFGRSGSRRRELMSQFVLPQGPNDSQALEKLLDTTKGKADSIASKPNPAANSKKFKKHFFDKWDQPKLLRFLESQRHQQRNTKGTTSWPGTPIRSIDPNQFVPKENSWGKPPAESLVRTKQAGWWRRSADKIMPPLGNGEWNLLGLLSSGGQESVEWAVPQRRTHAKPVGEGEEAGWNWQEYATKPVAIVENQKSIRQHRRSGQTDNGPYGVEDQGRNLSARWFRRAYDRTWQRTPTMAQDPNTLRYSITWGGVGSRLPPPTKTQLEIFEGVDQQGQKLPRDS